jgi:hypothetical protein
MRVLILSDTISRMQDFGKSPYHAPYDIQLDTGDLNKSEDFTFSVFDYDSSQSEAGAPPFPHLAYAYGWLKQHRQSRPPASGCG